MHTYPGSSEDQLHLEVAVMLKKYTHGRMFGE